MPRPIWRIALSIAGALAAMATAAGIYAAATKPDPIGPADREVSDKERSRRVPGREIRRTTLTAAPTMIKIGSRQAQTWAFNGSVPGPEVRAKAGDVLKVTVRNRLPENLTVHWHGIALRNDMDGVPELTQRPIRAGSDFTYTFVAPDPGTYFFHPHTGTQLDRGLYAPLIIEKPGEASAVPEVTLMLDDWIDGLGTNPDAVLQKLRQGGSQMGGMDRQGGMGGTSGDMGTMPGMGGESGADKAGSAMTDPKRPLGTDTGDVDYPLYLINGRPPEEPPVFDLAAGTRVRVRLINTAADTAFRVAVAGRRMTVTDTDGFPVVPKATDSLLIAMGERYDVLVDMPSPGVVPLVAVAEGKKGQALAVLRSGPGPLPAPDTRPSELDGGLLTAADLEPGSGSSIGSGKASRTYQVTLTGDMRSYRWGLTVPKQRGVPLTVRKGDRVRLVLDNQTMMWHPIHLHGHTFQLISSAKLGPRKDTIIVGPMSRQVVEFTADNPGRWMLHCHNVYHAESGMNAVLSYIR